MAWSGSHLLVFVRQQGCMMTSSCNKLHSDESIRDSWVQQCRGQVLQYDCILWRQQWRNQSFVTFITLKNCCVDDYGGGNEKNWTAKYIGTLEFLELSCTPNTLQFKIKFWHLNLQKFLRAVSKTNFNIETHYYSGLFWGELCIAVNTQTLQNFTLSGCAHLKFLFQGYNS